MKQDPISRRFFLQGLGNVAVAMPFLESLFWKRGFAFAQIPAGQKRRFVAIRFPNGNILPSDWFPGPSGAAGRPGNPINASRPELGFVESLASSKYNRADGGLSNVFGPRMRRFISKTNFLRGLDIIPYLGHNDGATLGNFKASDELFGDGWRQWATIDQVMASHIYPSGFRGVPVLSAAPAGTRFKWCLSYKADGSQQTAYSDPLAFFDRVYRDVPETIVGPVPPPSVDPKKKMLVDSVLGDYKSLRADSRISSSDQRLLDEHIAQIHELQRQVNDLTPPFPGCARETTRPAGMPNNINGATREQQLAVYNVFTKLMASALKCGVTQVATLNVSAADGVHEDGWHKTYAHNNNHARLKDIVRWVTDNVVYSLLDNLDVQEGSTGRTYLDNSLVFLGSEHGQLHSVDNLPCVTWGTAGGAIRAGNYIDYQRRGASFPRLSCNGTWPEMNEPGILMNEFWVSCLKAMGLQPQQYQRPGEAGYGDYQDVAGCSSTRSNLHYNGNFYKQVARGAGLPYFLV